MLIPVGVSELYMAVMHALQKTRQSQPCAGQAAESNASADTVTSNVPSITCPLEAFSSCVAALEGQEPADMLKVITVEHAHGTPILHHIFKRT